mmetsp:Transcript_4929/g.9395  ORF Transcript_4929/g.9395 Transcript_4929/m.9395 type:complete len:618 (+) Transcript_4929:194-2047(+)
MRTRFPLQGEQAEESAFPINCKVYICDDIDRNDSSCIVASGVVVSIFLHMERKANLELLYKVDVTRESSHTTTQQQNGLIRESRLRFCNGCPVHVHVNDIEFEQHKNQKIEGIVLGFYDIPKDDERRPYCSYSYWYVVQICGSSEDSTDKRILYHVSPSELRYRKVEIDRNEMFGDTCDAREEKICQNFSKELICSSNDEEINFLDPPGQAMPCIHKQSISNIDTDTESSKDEVIHMNRHTAKQNCNDDRNEDALMPINVPADFSPLKKDITFSAKDSQALASSIVYEESSSSPPQSNVQKQCEYVRQTNKNIQDKDQYTEMTNTHNPGSKRPHSISNYGSYDPCMVPTRPHLKLRRIDTSSTDDDDNVMLTTRKHDNGTENYEENVSLIRADLPARHCHEEECASIVSEKQNIDTQENNNRKSPLQQPSHASAVRPINSPIKEKTPSCSSTWIRTCRNKLFRSVRIPPRNYPFASITFFPASMSSTIVHDVLIGYRGSKRYELIKKMKCWYAISRNSGDEVQQIEIHGDTKTQVKMGTEIIREELSRWLMKCARRQEQYVDIKQWISINFKTRYYILDEYNDRLHSTQKSRLVHNDQETTLQILLPRISRKNLYSK